MKKVLFIDRDGTLALEPEDYQLDSFEKLTFYPGVFTYLGRIANELDYTLVMVTNQDGLGTDSFPEEQFWPVHNHLMDAMKNEGIVFEDVCIDKSFPADQAPTRKPETGLLTAYFSGDYDLENSFVIGDRLSDMQLAVNLGAQGILLQHDERLNETPDKATCSKLVNACVHTIVQPKKRIFRFRLTSMERGKVLSIQELHFLITCSINWHATEGLILN